MDIKSRIQKVMRSLKAHKIDLLLVEEPLDLLYLTGIPLSKGHLLISEKKVIGLVDGRYFLNFEKKFPFESRLLGTLNLEEVLEKEFRNKKNLGFEAEDTSYARFLELKKLNKKLLPLTNFIKAEHRQIKSSEEIKKIKKASKLTVDGFYFVKSHLKEGICEIEAVNALLSFFISRNAKPSFSPIIAFGENSASPHHSPGKRKLKKNEIVLIDLGASVDNYCSDMTRTFFFGKKDKKLIGVYEAVLKAQEKAIAKALPKTKLATLDKAARKELELHGFLSYFTHGLGHGVGIEIHEFPQFSKPSLDKTSLKPGMVITVEPGVYIPNLGGVRIEDTLLITPDGHEILTKCPKSIDLF